MADTDILAWSGGELDFSRGPVLMGILNVTPDSFSDGGEHADFETAVAHGLRMVSEGAGIIDVGAESTRPGSQPVTADEQIRRAVPVIERLATACGVPISIDTTDARVGRAAIEAGASIINDISACGSESMAELAAEKQVAIVLMHMQGTPSTMQASPEYGDVVTEVYDYLMARAASLEAAGVKRELIFIDPGIGFGKTIEHNLMLLGNLERFVSSGCRVLLGTSRKGFIGKLTGRDDPACRKYGTAATSIMGMLSGASILRVHDVAQNADAVKVAMAIKSYGGGFNR